MHIAVGATAPIPQFAPLAFEQIIIAGCDDDVTAREMFEWVSPLLAGIPNGRWMLCQLEYGSDGMVLAHYRDGGRSSVLSVTLDPGAAATHALTDQLPDAQSLTVILLSEFSSQAVTLLDGIARWLNIYDIEEHKVAPMLRLLGGIQTMLPAA